MRDAFTILCLGWPGIVASLLLSLAGLLWKKPILMVAGGAVFIPFSLYATTHGIPMIVVPILQFASAYAIWRGKRRLAWWLLVPLMAAIVILIIIAVIYSR